MVGNITQFTNILTPRRKEFSNFQWTIRKLNMTMPVKHTVKTTPQKLKANVLRSDKMQTIIRKLSAEDGVSVEELEKQIRIILDEIGFNHDMFTIRSLAMFLVKVNCKMYRGIHINANHINKLKSNMGTTPIVYVPNHRSYSDFVTMSYVLFTMNIAIPAIAAGMDFHSMWGMGTMMRNTGAFFMRRSYNNDNLYWDTFREYVHQLVTTIDCGVEFYIEGMRSRSSKSLYPKFGLLFMLLKAFFAGEVPDVLFVPIGISYDRVLEEKLFGFELLGVPKPVETTSGFFKSFSILKENYGNIYLHFGEPISSKEYFGSKMCRLKHTMKPLHMQELLPEEKSQVINLAEHIVHTQQELIVITTFNLISVIFTSSLMKEESIMRFDELVLEVIWLNKVMGSFGAMTNVLNPRNCVQEALDVHNRLVRVDEERNVTLLQNKIVLGNYDPKKLKGHALSEETMSVAVPFIMLQIYVNPTMHYFINHAIIVSILMGCEQISKDSLSEEYLFLRTLLSHEFTLFEYKAIEDFDNTLQKLCEMEVISEICDEMYALGKNLKLQNLLKNLLQPFLYTYFVVCNLLSEKERIGFPEKMLMAAVQEKIEQVVNTRAKFIHPYSLSLDTISNSLQSLVKGGALVKRRESNGNVYDTKLDIIQIVARKIEQYVKEQKIDESSKLIQLKNKL